MKKVCKHKINNKIKRKKNLEAAVQQQFSFIYGIMVYGYIGLYNTYMVWYIYI